MIFLDFETGINFLLCKEFSQIAGIEAGSLQEPHLSKIKSIAIFLISTSYTDHFDNGSYGITALVKTISLNHIFEDDELSG